MNTLYQLATRPRVIAAATRLALGGIGLDRKNRSGARPDRWRGTWPAHSQATAWTRPFVPLSIVATVLILPKTDNRRDQWLPDEALFEGQDSPPRHAEGEGELNGHSAYAYNVEAELEMDLGRVALVHERFAAPLDICGSSGTYHLQLAMLPNKRASMSCYRDYWTPHRFEPMGDLFILPAKSSTHTMAWCEEQRSLVCSIDPERADNWLGPDFAWTDGSLVRSLNIVSAEVRRLLYRVAAELENPGHASRMLVEALVAQACVELSRYLREPAGCGVKGGLAPWRMRIVEQEVTRDPGRASVDAIARKCGFSVRQLSRAFRASRGQTLADFIAGHRIGLAREMLEDGASVKQTAYAAGFSSPSNFATAFQREVGCAPRIYRAHQLARA